jgi:histidinol phosphatase-like PHP family hydrolase
MGGGGKRHSSIDSQRRIPFVKTKPLTAAPRNDFHVHTKYLKCANDTMDIPAIVKACERLGVTAIGITDHLGSMDKLELHVPIKQDIEALAPAMDVYFGVELHYLVLDGPFVWNAEIKEQYGFQFAIGGPHNPFVESYDLKKIVDIQHRLHLKTCRDPLVDVLVHPYWFSKGEFDKHGWPWFDSMQVVPESYARELAQTAKATGTAIEINGTGCIVNPCHSDRYVKEYIEFLSIVASEGACFSLGSDAHDLGHLKNVQPAWQVAEQLHLTAEQIWFPKCSPLKRDAKS